MALAEFDHLIVLAPRLKRAVDQCAASGFEVRSGGRFPAGVPFHNALIGFPNETYIELLGVQRTGARVLMRALYRLGLLDAMLRSRTARDRRIGGLLGEPAGVVDLCLRVQTIDGALLERQSGIGWECSDMQRETPSGEFAQWQMAFPSDPRLPFLISDRTPRGRRIPSRVLHSNGALGLGEVRLSLRGLAQIVPLYEWLLGSADRSEPAAVTWTSLGTRIVLDEENSGRRAFDIRARVSVANRARSAQTLAPGLSMA